MKTLSTLGRFIFAIPFIVFGAFHFMKAGDMSGLIGKWPFAEGLVYISGLALMLGGVSILINVKARLASLLLALLLLIFILGIHIPALMNGNQMEMGSLLKDTALLGAALTYSGILKS
jgi:putative oxidoreductase